MRIKSQIRNRICESTTRVCFIAVVDFRGGHVVIWTPLISQLTFMYSKSDFIDLTFIWFFNYASLFRQSSNDLKNQQLMLELFFRTRSRIDKNLDPLFLKDLC